MKKYIILRLVILVTITSLVLMTLGAVLQFQVANDRFLSNSAQQIDRIATILTENEAYIASLQEELKNDYLVRADAAAYIIDNNEDVIDSVPEMQKIADHLQVDEIHVFDSSGTIYSGTTREYFGVDMYSGEQIGFFLPMLEDFDLRLAQDVTPNTAESRDMQYVAVWSESHENIVQVGIEPVRLLEAMEETGLDYIFSNMVTAPGVSIFALEQGSEVITNSTDSELVGKEISEVLMTSVDINLLPHASIPTNINNELGQAYMQISNDIIIGVAEPNDIIYSAVPESIMAIVLSGIVIGAIIILLLYLLLEKTVLRGFSEINDGMNTIVRGDLTYKLSVKGLPEFEQLSDNVNIMLQSVLENTGRFSTVFQYINLPIAMYECRSDSVFFTSKLGEILDNPSYLTSGLTIDPFEFKTHIKNIMHMPYSNESDVYVYKHGNAVKYLKLKEYSQESSDWGVVLDVTQEIIEKQSIRFERDIDFLTGIFNRRAFLERITELSKDPTIMKNAVFMMMDLDNLKHVNDSWGHAYGDKFISSAADVLIKFESENKLVARFSGDEFVILIYGAETSKELEGHIDALHKDFEKAYIKNPDGEKYPITISGGYALYPEQTAEFKELLHLADKTMYEVKRESKGSFKKCGIEPVEIK